MDCACGKSRSVYYILTVPTASIILSICVDCNVCVAAFFVVVVFIAVFLAVTLKSLDQHLVFFFGCLDGHLNIPQSCMCD